MNGKPVVPRTKKVWIFVLKLRSHKILKKFHCQVSAIRQLCKVMEKVLRFSDHRRIKTHIFELIAR